MADIRLRKVKVLVYLFLLIFKFSPSFADCGPDTSFGPIKCNCYIGGPDPIGYELIYTKLSPGETEDQACNKCVSILGPDATTCIYISNSPNDSPKHHRK